MVSLIHQNEGISSLWSIHFSYIVNPNSKLTSHIQVYKGLLPAMKTFETATLMCPFLFNDLIDVLGNMTTSEDGGIAGPQSKLISSRTQTKQCRQLSRMFETTWGLKVSTCGINSL